MRPPKAVAASELYPGRRPLRASARSLLLTLLGEFVLPARRPTPNAALVAGLGRLGVRPATARQALSRSNAAGWIEPLRRGRTTSWTLASSFREILAEGRERIHALGTRPTPADASWILLHVTVPEGRRGLRRKIATRLTWAGFGSPAPGLWLSPHAERAEVAREILDDLRLRGVFSLEGRPGALGSTAQLVERAWDLATLDERYRAFLDDLQDVRPRGPEESFRAVAELVHAWRAFPFLDPELPDSLLPAPWHGHRAARRFHTLHARWRGAARAWWDRAVA